MYISFGAGPAPVAPGRIQFIICQIILKPSGLPSPRSFLKLYILILQTRLMEKREFEYKAYAGLKNYHQSKKRIEFLSISVSKESNIDIMDKFQKLYDRMFVTSKYGRFMNKEYIGVMVNHQHMHILLKKPFVHNQALSNDWDYLVGSHANLECKTVIMSESSIKRVVNYCVNQGDQHETDDVIFFDNPYWGVIKKTIKPKKEEIENKENWRKRKIKYEGSYMIDGNFVSKQEYEDYVKLHPIEKLSIEYKQEYPKQTEEFYQLQNQLNNEKLQKVKIQKSKILLDTDLPDLTK